MISLSCDTSTLLGSVAVHRDGQLLAYQEQFRQNSHSDSLNLLIAAALKEAQLELTQIDSFGSGLGPGSFTGIRISINTIKTFAYIYKKPCFGLDSLTNLAYVNQGQVGNESFVCGINAFKNMIYLGVFQFNGDTLNVLLEPQVVRVQNLQNYIQNRMFFIGDAFTAYEKYFASRWPDLFKRNEYLRDHPRADFIHPKQIKPNAIQHWSSLHPLYLRASEAEENINGIKYQPL